MKLRQSGPTALLMLGLAQAASAQQPAAPAPPPAAEQRPVDVERLPVDVERIQRQLRQQTTVREDRDGLKLRFQVEVYAPAPPIVLFPESNVQNFWTAPAPYGAPTHGEILSLITPREHGGGRIGPNGVPGVDLGWLFRQFRSTSTRVR